MQLFLISLLLMAVSLGLTSSSGLNKVKLVRGNCPMFWFSYKGGCYKYVASRMTWADAELHCVSLKANLVSIHSLEENNFVVNLINNFDPARHYTWIGLSDHHKEARWMWSDGCPVSFTRWSASQPDNAGGNEDCVEIFWNGSPSWNDRLCSSPSPFVCATRKFVC